MSKPKPLQAKIDWKVAYDDLSKDYARITKDYARITNAISKASLGAIRHVEPGMFEVRKEYKHLKRLIELVWKSWVDSREWMTCDDCRCDHEA